ncbi:hypothetical protein FKP32DRAFT_1595092 [Trametes sanguinea]|nr:hypothetical protein FKP32DRAFT_1595092 [Trametes sanguinea]
MPGEPPYSRIPSSPRSSTSDAFERLHIVDGGGPSRAPPRRWPLSESSAWKLFLTTCTAVLALSALNLLSLSSAASLSSLSSAAAQNRAAQARLRAGELKRPSVYLGLDRVPVEPGYCRSRGTFPRRFWTYDADAGARAVLERVHAPDDKTTLRFGGPVRVVVDAYIPDHGLENCTLSLRRIPASSSSDDSPASAASLSKTGFQITQYEGMECIPARE